MDRPVPLHGLLVLVLDGHRGWGRAGCTRPATVQAPSVSGDVAMSCARSARASDCPAPPPGVNLSDPDALGEVSSRVTEAGMAVDRKYADHYLTMNTLRHSSGARNIHVTL